MKSADDVAKEIVNVLLGAGAHDPFAWVKFHITAYAEERVKEAQADYKKHLGDYCSNVDRSIQQRVNLGSLYTSEDVAEIQRNTYSKCALEFWEEARRKKGEAVEIARAEGFAAAREMAAKIADEAYLNHAIYLMDNVKDRNLRSVEGFIADKIRAMEDKLPNKNYS